MQRISKVLLTDDQIKNILRKWSVPEDIIEMFGISREREIAKAQALKLVQELEKRGLLAHDYIMVRHQDANYIWSSGARCSNECRLCGLKKEIRL